MVAALNCRNAPAASGLRASARRRFLLLALWLGLLAAPAAENAPATPEKAGPEPRIGGAGLPDAIDDRRTLKLLHDQGAKLIAEARTVKMAALIEQLKTASCRLETAAPAKQAVPPERLYEQAKRSVLVVGALYKCDKCNDWHVAASSGFVLSAGGAICTNYHVVDSPARETLVALTADGRVLPVKSVLAASKSDDVAILQLDGKDLVPAPLAAGAPVGSRVSVISHPDNRFFMYTTGVVSRYFQTRAKGGKGDTTMMAITADYARGSSGGPVFNERGEVVGMVSSTFSIYYEGTKHDNLQMVVKECVPAANILKLIGR